MTHAAPDLIWSLPFALVLLQIAVWPATAPHAWEKYYPWLTLPLGVIVAVYYLFSLHATDHVFHVAHEYFSFIALIGSLYVVSGGLLIAMVGQFTPRQNLALLGIGAILANVVGTTGASMILIRPYLRGNTWRFRKYHIAFFIFVVANFGGGLTPIGDPPLFLGYLRGVPFFWVLQAIWYKWFFATALLLAIFYWVDARDYRRHKEFERTGAEQEDIFRLMGKWNLLFLAVIVGAAFVQRPVFLREGLMIGAAAASYFTTSKHVHERNHFSFHPVREVAILFAAIFATMMPALDWLSQHAGELGIATTTQFYWLTGGLSAVLDNAPTYLNFLTTAAGLHGMDVNNAADVGRFARDHGELLGAISISAVFFGAMTYIGNGPNFMCKAIAESAKLSTPTFAEYIYKYALPFLLPVLALTWLMVI